MRKWKWFNNTGSDTFLKRCASQTEEKNKWIKILASSEISCLLLPSSTLLHRICRHVPHVFKQKRKSFRFHLNTFQINGKSFRFSKYLFVLPNIFKFHWYLSALLDNLTYVCTSYITSKYVHVRKRLSCSIRSYNFERNLRLRLMSNF